MCRSPFKMTYLIGYPLICHLCWSLMRNWPESYITQMQMRLTFMGAIRHNKPIITGARL